MPNWFQFKNTRSSTLGIYVSEFPPITLPEERVEFVEVPGRSGSLAVLEGDNIYEDITLPVECFVRDMSRINEIGAWLRGSGDLVLGNMPGYSYKARVVNQIAFDKLMRGRENRTLSVVFRCAPFRYQYPAATPISLTSSGSIHNPGTLPSEPVITVRGSGDIDLTIAGQLLELNAVSGSITVDVPIRLAYSNGQNQSYKLTGQWPLLPVGNIPISWTGSVSSVEITPNWRYL